MSYVRDLAVCAAAPLELVGGKAVGLGRLLEQSLEVPPGFVVTTDAFRAWIERNDLEREIAQLVSHSDGLAAEHDAASRIAELFAEAQLEDAEIDDAYMRLPGGPDAPVAVRSSATGEDTKESSYAGQQATFLWVTGPETVRHQITSCWASLFSAEAISYRKHLGLRPEQAAMAVVVQAMVPAQAAGVMFTVDPLTGDPSQVTIESTVGLGEPLVAGEVSPDRYCVDKVTREIRDATTASKPFADRFDERLGAIRRVPLVGAEADASSLREPEVIRLAEIGTQLERAIGTAMDVEWAVGPDDGGGRRIYLLQARPDTAHRSERQMSQPGTSALERIALGMRTSRAITGGL